VNGEIEVTMDPKALPSSANRREKRLDWHRSISWARDSFFWGVDGRIVFLVAPFFFLMTHMTVVVILFICVRMPGSFAVVLFFPRF
jgi:hypothetical protein